MHKNFPPRLAKASHSSTSTPPSAPLKRGIKFWNPKSLYPYWEIPKNKLLIKRAKDLRKAGNLSEVLFWQTFKDKKEFGFDIDRQVIIGNYIIDFFIPELGLVFEIDGSSHDGKIEYDAERDNFMQSLSLKIVRISDSDVRKNMVSVYDFVFKTIKGRETALKFPS